MLFPRRSHSAHVTKAHLLLAVSVLFSSSIALGQTAAYSTQTQLSVTSNGAAVTTVPSGTQLTLTAQITADGGNVSLGSVEFCDTTLPACASQDLVGYATVSNTGTASMSFIPPAGEHNYVAFLTNATPYEQSVSGIATVNVVSPSLSQQASDFTLTLSPGSSSTQVLPAGTSNASFNFILTPVGGNTLPPITVAVSNMPSWAQATVTPQSISTGSAKVSVQLGLAWSNLATLQKVEYFGKSMAPVTLSLLVLPFAGLMRKSRKKFARVAFALVLTIASAGAMSGLTGCGTGVHTSATLTATAGSVTHSQTVYFMDGI